MSEAQPANAPEDPAVAMMLTHISNMQSLIGAQQEHNKKMLGLILHGAEIGLTKSAERFAKYIVPQPGLMPSPTETMPSEATA
jgi:hypothetical protein